jgi:hypothetical protein
MRTLLHTRTQRTRTRTHAHPAEPRRAARPPDGAGAGELPEAHGYRGRVGVQHGRARHRVRGAPSSCALLAPRPWPLTLDPCAMCGARTCTRTCMACSYDAVQPLFVRSHPPAAACSHDSAWPRPPLPRPRHVPCSRRHPALPPPPPGHPASAFPLPPAHGALDAHVHASRPTLYLHLRVRALAMPFNIRPLPPPARPPRQVIPHYQRRRLHAKLAQELERSLEEHHVATLTTIAYHWNQACMGHEVRLAYASDACVRACMHACGVARGGGPCVPCGRVPRGCAPALTPPPPMAHVCGGRPGGPSPAAPPSLPPHPPTCPLTPTAHPTPHPVLSLIPLRKGDRGRVLAQGD